MLRAFYVAASLIAVASSAKPAAANQPFIFFNSHTDMCLQPLNQSTAQGVAIVQEPCTIPTPPTEAQEWIYVPNGSACFHFENALSGLCLDARVRPKVEHQCSNGRATKSATRTGIPRQVPRDRASGRCVLGFRVATVSAWTYQGAADCRTRHADLPLQWDTVAGMGA